MTEQELLTLATPIVKQMKEEATKAGITITPAVAFKDPESLTAREKGVVINVVEKYLTANFDVQALPPAPIIETAEEIAEIVQPKKKK